MASPLIAVLSSQYSTYQKTVVDALDSALRAHQYELIHFAGGALQPRQNHENTTPTPIARNAIFRVARNVDVAGYMILNDAIGDHASLDALSLFTQEFAHKPLVSLGVVIDGLPSVALDNYNSMVELMLHMTEDCNRHRFVFIRGYPDHPSSVLREKAFRDVLAKRQIPVDESLVIDGNFIAADAYFALDTLLSKNNNIDAVIAANNEMAQSAIHALTRHALRVPEDVIVSGFENSDVAERTLMPVTTMDDLLMQQVYAAAENIIDQINHPSHPARQSPSKLFKANLIVRTTSELRTVSPELHNDEPAANFQKLRDSITANVSQIKAPVSLKIEDIVDTIMSMFVSNPEHLKTWHKQLQLMMYEHPEDIHWWRYLLHSIGKSLAQSNGDSYGFVSVLNATNIQAQLNSLIWSIEATRNVTEARYRDSVARLRNNLSECSTVEQLESTLRLSIQQFSLLQGFICLYEYSGGFPSERSRLIFQHPRDVIQCEPTDLFQTDELLPHNYLQTKTPGHGLLVEPLCVGSTHLGYLILDRGFGRIPEIVYPAEVAMDISNALYRCF